MKTARVSERTPRRIRTWRTSWTLDSNGPAAIGPDPLGRSLPWLLGIASWRPDVLPASMALAGNGPGRYRIRFRAILWAACSVLRHFSEALAPCAFSIMHACMASGEHIRVLHEVFDGRRTAGRQQNRQRQSQNPFFSFCAPFLHSKKTMRVAARCSGPASCPADRISLTNPPARSSSTAFVRLGPRPDSDAPVYRDRPVPIRRCRERGYRPCDGIRRSPSPPKSAQGLPGFSEARYARRGIDDAHSRQHQQEHRKTLRHQSQDDSQDEPHHRAGEPVFAAQDFDHFRVLDEFPVGPPDGPRSLRTFSVWTSTTRTRPYSAGGTTRCSRCSRCDAHACPRFR